MRKTRRKIQRRKKSKSKPKKRKLLERHFNSPVTNKYTKITTAVIILLELLWILIETAWFIIDIFVRG